MPARLALTLTFAVLGLVAVVRSQAVTARGPNLDLEASRPEFKEPPLQPGSFPETWINGVDCDTEPTFQVHAYNEDLFIIRQSKCKTYEAPFLYLIFGEDRALLYDTGANAQTPLVQVVRNLVTDWLDANDRESIPLTVTHSHGHFDHVAGDDAFATLPWVDEVVGTSVGAVSTFFGFQDYPNDIPSIDLGGRVIDAIGTPGHHPAHVALYDRNTQLLLSGDHVYPGHLFVFTASDWPIFRESIARLVAFASENPVEWVTGCHIEMSSTPFVSYAYGTSVQPDEHTLEFRPTILLEILNEIDAMGANEQCEIFAEFVLHPTYKCGGLIWNG